MSTDEDIKLTVMTPPDLHRALRDAVTQGRAADLQDAYRIAARFWLGLPAPESASKLPKDMKPEEEELVGDLIRFWRGGGKKKERENSVCYERLETRARGINGGEYY